MLENLESLCAVLLKIKLALIFLISPFSSLSSLCLLFQFTMISRSRSVNRHQLETNYSQKIRHRFDQVVEIERLMPQVRKNKIIHIFIFSDSVSFSIDKFMSMWANLLFIHSANRCWLQHYEGTISTFFLGFSCLQWLKKIFYFKIIQLRSKSYKFLRQFLFSCFKLRERHIDIGWNKRQKSIIINHTQSTTCRWKWRFSLWFYPIAMIFFFSLCLYKDQKESLFSFAHISFDCSLCAVIIVKCISPLSHTHFFASRTSS